MDYPKFIVYGSSNKFWQWFHISETGIEIRIVLPIACGVAMGVA